jgi:polysaccharide export outer membrane protein
MRITKLFLLSVALLLTAYCVQAQDEPKKENLTAAKKNVSTPDTNTGGAAILPKPATDDPNYIIGPDDQVDVSVWGESNVSRSVPVRPDGKISLPLLNDVQAAGLTPMQLGNEITTRLNKFIESPQVTVIITRVNSQRIFILGEVARAGAYPLLPNMTILAALSSAGGFTPFAKQSKVHVLRVQDGKQLNIPFNYKEVISGHHPEENVVLKPGDTIVVP